MVDWGGKVAAWFAGVLAGSAAVAALILAEAVTPLHGEARFWFVVLVVIAIASFAALLLIGLRAVWTTWHDRRERRSRRHVLSVGERLSVGESLWSDGERVRLHFQEDGNLVVKTARGATLYGLDTNGEGGAYAAVTADGRWALFAADGTEIRGWGNGGGVKLKVQDDANLCLYPETGKAVWAINVVFPGIG